MNRYTCLPILVAVLVLAVTGCRRDPYEARSNTPCVDGRAGPFHCDGLDLARLFPWSDLGIDRINDLWGWHDDDNDRDYLIVGGTSGAVIVDSTDPIEAEIVGRVPGQDDTFFGESTWRDIKVVNDHAFIGSEAGGFGVQVVDLTRLDGLPRGDNQQLIEPDAHYAGDGDTPLGSSHNLVSLPEANLLAAVDDTGGCGQQDGFHFIDVSDPAAPSFAGCVSGFGYVHDGQCVVYDGPDTDRAGRHICIAFANIDPNSDEAPAESEDTVALVRLVIVDVTDLDEPEVLSNTTYPNGAYAHQGWLTEDHRFLLGNDEADETTQRVNTRTLVWDLSDLEEPVFVGGHNHGTAASDHNLFVRGDLVYQANYRAGVRVLELGDLTVPELTQVAYFDTYPLDDKHGWRGAWGVYPFQAGLVAVTSIEEGLFLLTPQDGL